MFELFSVICMEMLGTNIVDPDQTPHSVVSDLGLHCLHMTCPSLSELVLGFSGKYFEFLVKI